MMQRTPPGMLFDEKTYTYVDRKTGEVVPAERLDEYAQKVLNQAVDRLAKAWVGAVHKNPGTRPGQ